MSVVEMEVAIVRTTASVARQAIVEQMRIHLVAAFLEGRQEEMAGILAASFLGLEALEKAEAETIAKLREGARA